MSWVQQQQQPQHPPPPPQQHGAAPPAQSPPTMNTNAAAFLGKPSSNSTMRPQGNPAAGALPFHPSQQQQQQPLLQNQQQHPHVQGHISNQPQQPQQWQQQQAQNYLQHNTNKMMQPSATNNWQQQQNVANANAYQQHATAANNWQQPELQAAPVPTQQQHPQQQHQQPPPATYGNYYAQAATQQQQQHAQQHQSQQQQQPQQQHYPQQQPHDTSTFFQPPPQQQHAASAMDFFDNNVSNNSNNNISVNSSINNNTTTKSDGWGDWDWNDNSGGSNAIELQQQQLHEQPQPLTPQQQQQHQQQPPPPHHQQQPPQHHQQQLLQQQQQPHQPTYSATNIIADSFSTNTNDNNNWHWGGGAPNDVATANTTADQHATVATLPLAPLTPAAAPSSFSTTSPQVPISIESQQQPPAPPVNSFQVPTSAQQQLLPQVADLAATTAKQQADHLEYGANVAAKPTSLPLFPDASNENYNMTAVVATSPPSAAAGVGVPPPPNNIPNSVYVSQAKPVARPPRQYASPPGGNTPVAAAETITLENTLTPPQGFQNETPPPPTSSATTADVSVAPSAVLPPPPAAMPLPPPSAAAVLPPPGGAMSAAVNPFKRAGAAQHHRAGIMPTTAVAAATEVAPPPPVDFATLMPISGNNPNLMPDNSEVLHENQEVIAPTPSFPVIAPAAAVSPPLPPPPASNNERYQYLQTSHLSENPDADGELNNVESAGGDSLPPPGLSRLVLGEPELDASPPPPPQQQRMVTGTEEPSPVSLTIAQQNMHIEERHADGEDNSMELNAVPRGLLAGSANASALLNSSTNQIDITTDRSLYQVPGESNANIAQRQRVVTGVETDEESSPVLNSSINITNMSNTSLQQHTQGISGQREIELDGENLEDQQQQQQQQQLHPPPQRNELPLEGAAANAEVSIPQATLVEAAETLHQHQQQQQQQHHAKSKDHHSNISTGNDESDPPPAQDSSRHNRHFGSKKVEKKRSGELVSTSVTESASGKQRRGGGGDKQRASMDRYEESEDESGAEYSSDRERRRRDYREGSVRSERERKERAEREEFLKEKRRREKRESGGSGDKSRGYRDYRESDKKTERGGGERRSGGGGQRYSSRGYDLDAKYETEESTSRHELNLSRKEQTTRRSMRAVDERGGGGGGRSDRSDRDYDDYRGRGPAGGYRGSKRDKAGANAIDDDRRDRDRRLRREREDYEVNTLERRRRNDKRQSGGGGGHTDYEEYRKQSSRNARESDMEKDRERDRGMRDPRDPRTDPRYDARHAAAYASGYHGHHPHHHAATSGAYGYDPYAYYYEQMARTNPQAYAEWYKKYYGHAAATAAVSGVGSHAVGGGAGVADQLLTGGSSSLAATDGRESVHSGRSSTHNEKDRYTQAYISQANEYHRHYHQLHHQQQQQQQLASSVHHNLSLNAAMLEESMSSSAYGYSGALLRGARSTSNLSQIHSTSFASGGGGGGGGGASYYALPERAYYARSEYAESRSGNISLRDNDPVVGDDPQRLTPCKFINEHAVVSLSAGILLTVKPKYTHGGNSISNIVKIQRLGANDATRPLFQAFPGPLVRGLTHKKTIIEFCEEQIRLGPMQTTIYAKQLLSPTSNAEKYGASYTLMWNLLILLLRQNGMVVGTDIAELLLKNQQQYPYRVHTPNSSANNSLKTQSKAGSVTPDGSEDEADQEKLSDDGAVDEQPKSSTTTLQENPLTIASSAKSDGDSSLSATAKSFSSTTLTETKVTEKFRNYLLYGNVNEALDWATDNNLWGHALFLASKVDRRSHANVMMKFANKLSLNDPLQTLYQLMSGRTPSSVTSVQDEKWGDWRPHLSMILSNTSQKPELDRKAITTLGDSLFNRGDLFAAHFCYLMAQVGFGRYQESAAQESTLQQSLPKLVLLGSSQYKNFRDFASNEAIMMTEIYEYACSLNDDKFSLVEFQPYKYLLATRLLDYGYHLKSLMYMEQIAMHIQRDPSKYEPSFVNKIFEFGDRLKYYDPVLEKTMDDQHQTDGNLSGSLPQFEEQKWLQDLRVIASQHNIAYAPPVYTPASVSDTQENTYGMQNKIDQEFAEINKQFNELNLQYSRGNSNAEQPAIYNPETMQLQQQQPKMPVAAASTAVESNEHYNQQQHQQLHQQQPTQTDYEQQQLQQHYVQQQQQQPAVSADVTAAATAANALDPYANYAQQQQQPYLQPDQQQLQNSYYDPTQQQQPQYNHMEAADAQTAVGSTYAEYDYWSAQQQQQQQQQQQFGDEPKAYLEAEIEAATQRATPAATVATAASTNQQLQIKNNIKTTAAAKITPTKSSKVSQAAPTRQIKSSTLEKSKLQQNSRHQQLYGITATTSAAALAAKNRARNQEHFNKTAAAKSAAAAASTSKTTSATTFSHSQQQQHQQQQQFLTNDNAPRPTISMPKSKSYDSEGETQQQQRSSGDSSQAKKNAKNDAKEPKLGAPQSNQNSGWFGGIWNKLSLKPKNQMILPDDKNPAIVWDAERKRWTNTDGEEATEDSLKPPPKMSDLMPQQMPPPQQQQQQHLQQQQPQQLPLMDAQQYGGGGVQQQTASLPPATSAAVGFSATAVAAATPMAAAAAAPTATNDVVAAPKPPSLQSNMFKMQRNRTLKNSYVDVFNPSGAPMSKASESVMAPALPPAAVPQGGYFIPGAAPSDAAAAYQPQQQQQQQVPQQDVPQFYNPNQYGGAAY